MTASATARLVMIPTTSLMRGRLVPRNTTATPARWRFSRANAKLRIGKCPDRHTSTKRRGYFSLSATAADHFLRQPWSEECWPSLAALIVLRQAAPFRMTDLRWYPPPRPRKCWCHFCKARAQLMRALQKTVRGWNLSQKASADRLGLTQPRLNDLLRGKIDKFSLDALFDLTGRVGLKVSIALRKAA